MRKFSLRGGGDYIRLGIEELARMKISMLAANTGYFIVLSVFPALLLLLSGLRYTGLSVDDLLEALEGVIPHAMMSTARGLILSVYNNASGTVAGVSALTLYDTRPEVAHALAGRLHQHYPQLDITLMQPDPAGHELVVNATPLGMKASDPLPLDVERLAPGAWVGEVVMTQEYTPLLRAAQARQCHIQRGTDMLFEMIPAYLRFFDLPVATPEQLRALAEIRY